MSEHVSQRIEGVEGVVKWFDDRKGFGFIIGPDGSDIFTHYTVIEGEGFRSLKDGSVVKYDAVRTEKGWKATKVARMAEPLLEVKVTRPRGYVRTARH